MLDNEDEVFLWQGWWPNVTTEENNLTGSRGLRWSSERRCAMETVLQFCQLKAKADQPPPVAYLVSAGVEPLSFTNLFPEWTVNEEVTQLNVQVNCHFAVISYQLHHFKCRKEEILERNCLSKRCWIAYQGPRIHAVSCRKILYPKVLTPLDWSPT